MTEPDKLTPEPLTHSGETVGRSSLALMSFVNLPEGPEFNLAWCCAAAASGKNKNKKKKQAQGSHR